MTVIRAWATMLIAIAWGVSPTFAAGRCVTFETEVVSVDPKGEIHPLFNFVQGLKAGESWSVEMRGESSGDLVSGVLSVKVTWDLSSGDPEPTMVLGIRVPQGGQVPPLEATAVLEETLWDSLFGPEVFKVKSGAALDLGPLGHAVAVVAARSGKCESK